ncbi:hypothetical protein RZS08_47385, partial [Arthrospira platensis SPKY1]|nr:hypothetical protein [Arthrospira platensis SPKY1]
NSTLLGASIAAHQPNFSDFEAFVYTLPTMLADDPETGIELGLTATALAVSTAVPGVGFAAGAGAAALGLNRLNKMRKISNIVAGGIRGFHAVSKPTRKVSKLINPF